MQTNDNWRAQNTLLEIQKATKESIDKRKKVEGEVRMLRDQVKGLESTVKRLSNALEQVTGDVLPRILAQVEILPQMIGNVQRRGDSSGAHIPGRRE